MNEYLSFYEKYKISPVVQNIDNFKEHVNRRTNLYRQLSVLPITFKDKDILEVGPGGGYNALVTYTYEPKTYTLIEPNATGYNQLLTNFKEINKGNLYIFNTMLEDFKTTKKYDIVMCEGLIAGLSKRDSFIQELQFLVKPNGILIMTTSDEISVFFEIVRKYLAKFLIQGIPHINEQVAILVDAFSTHLESLKGMTRSYQDWCLDNLIGNAILEHTLSFNQIVNLVENDFYFLGSSPDIFTNYTWYKELPTNTIEYNKIFKEQFLKQWHNFIDYRVINQERDANKNLELAQYCFLLINSVKQNDDQPTIVALLEKIKINLHLDITEKTILTIEEIITLLKSDITVEKIKKMKFFNSAFGRGQSYISFVKQHEN